MIYRCRFLKPKLSEWFEVEEDSPGAAVQSLHSAEGGGIRYRHDLGDGKSERITFALIETEGHGELVSRMYYQGIIRQGRAGSPPTLAQIAQTLGFERDPNTLLDKWDKEGEWASATVFTIADRQKVKPQRRK